MNIKFSELTIKQLINMCLLSNKEAWNEFFRRYTPTIQQSIKRALAAKDLHRLANDKNNIQDIYLEVVDLLWMENCLSTLEDPNKCEAWLKIVSIRKTIDWIRKYNRQKNLSTKQAEESILSLSVPQNENGSITLGDTIFYSRSPFTQGENELHEYVDEMKKLPMKELWALRIKLIFYDPLTNEEIRELSRCVQMPAEEISARLESIMEGLLKKNDAKEKERESAGRIHSIIINLQDSLLKSKLKSDISEDERKRINDEIIRKDKSLKAVRESSSVFIEPGNEQIAELMGIPREKAQGVSLLVHRARKKIKDGLKNKAELSDGNTLDYSSSKGY